MGSFVLKNCVLSINGPDLSAYTRSVRLNYTTEVPETSAYGITSKTFINGLKDWSVDCEFVQDYASSLDGVLFNLVGSTVAFRVRNDSAATSALNPCYNGNVIVTAYPPIGNSIGETAKTSVHLEGTGALTYTVA